MNFNTQDAPWSANLTAADQAGERFRANVGTVRRLAAVPAEWADRFTPAEWSEFNSARFAKYHSEASIMSPEEYLNRPVAVLVAVDGTTEGDYLIPFEGDFLRGGETLLSKWQVDDLIERGYSFA
jgi:hypothetical protein